MKSRDLEWDRQEGPSHGKAAVRTNHASEGRGEPPLLVGQSGGSAILVRSGPLSRRILSASLQHRPSVHGHLAGVITSGKVGVLTPGFANEDARRSVGIATKSARCVGSLQGRTPNDPVAIRSEAQRDSSEQILVVVMNASPDFSHRWLGRFVLGPGLFVLSPGLFPLEGLAV
jgi:hypothetical protein